MGSADVVLHFGAYECCPKYSFCKREMMEKHLTVHVESV